MPPSHSDHWSIQFDHGHQDLKWLGKMCCAPATQGTRKGKQRREGIMGSSGPACETAMVFSREERRPAQLFNLQSDLLSSTPFSLGLSPKRALAGQWEECHNEQTDFSCPAVTHLEAHGQGAHAGLGGIVNTGSCAKR